MDISELPKYLARITEAIDDLSEQTTVLLMSSVTSSSPNSKIIEDVEQLLDLQGHSSVLLFDLKNASWHFTLLKRTLSGPRSTVANIKKNIDEYKSEITGLALAIRSNLFVIKDRVYYLRSKYDL